MSQSYLTFFFAVILGVIFDIIFNVNILTNNIFQYTGLVFILLGTILAYWAQNSSRIAKEKWQKDHIDVGFSFGPYKYSRNPTHLGLFIMTMGFAFIIGSTFSLFFVIIAYIITKTVYLKKEEKILAEKYGEEYSNYKKKIKGIL